MLQVAAYFVYGRWTPLLHRVRLGEGGLFLVNLALIWRARPAPAAGLLRSALSLLVLSALYEFNDLWDVRDDLKNPKKSRRLVLLLLRNARWFYLEFVAEQAVMIYVAYRFVGAASVGALLCVVLINAAYSTHLKGLPLLDVLSVGFWGASYAAIPETRWRICLLVGLLTAISHIYQMSLDMTIDRMNDVRTTAVHSRALMMTIFFLLCGSIALTLRRSLGGVAVVSGFVPLVLWFAFSDKTAWFLSKIYCAIILWAAMGARVAPR